MTNPDPPCVHIVGAGLAGLSAAVELSRCGIKVVVYEAAGHAGGRCRSFEDRVLGCMIDNGNHLVLSGNTSTASYLEAIGADHAFWSPQEAVFPFFDLQSGERWEVRPNHGRIPWWIFDQARRIPGTGPMSYLGAARLAMASRGETVAALLDPGTNLYNRFWEPLVVAALNAVPAKASAQLVWRAMRETFGRGGAHCRPMIARNGLSAALVSPALNYIQSHGGMISYNRRLQALDRDAECVGAVKIAGESIELGPRDKVVLAVPPAQVARLVPEIEVPGDGGTIVNAHFRLNEPLAPGGEPSFLGLVGGLGHWIFTRGDVVSVTISAADQLGLANRSQEKLLPILWDEIQQALSIAGMGYVTARLIREHRATFDQSPTVAARRPKAVTRWPNLFLAGDYTQTGIPATIEGAIRSGTTAARHCIADLQN